MDYYIPNVWPRNRVFINISATASRLSQRLIVSLAQILQEEPESWDIGNAFLQGSSFAELAKRAKELGYELKGDMLDGRVVHLKPPPNVWRHLNNSPDFDFHIDFHDLVI